MESCSISHEICTRFCFAFILMRLCCHCETNPSEIFVHIIQDLHSLSRRTSYHKISWGLEAMRLDDIVFVPFSNLTGISRCCRSACQISERLDKFKHTSRGFVTSRDRSCSTTYVRLVNRGQGLFPWRWDHHLIAPVPLTSLWRQRAKSSAGA